MALQVSKAAMIMRILPDASPSEDCPDGAWGVLARIDIPVPMPQGGYYNVQVESGGLWDMDVSDRNDPHVQEVFEEEKVQLAYILTQLGLDVVD